MEREAFDLFGIVFVGHPDMTRILMPEDWEGHPLRKDYGVGRVPVQFKEAPGPTMSAVPARPAGDRTTATPRPTRCSTPRSRAPPSYDPSRRRRAAGAAWPRRRRAARSSAVRDGTAPDELRREVGAVLRLPEGVAVDPSDIDIELSDDETMIINMGPQHPSTHGVLRLMFELDGETVLRTKPVIGYLHTGMEKTGEELTYVQGSTNVTRMDYLSPLANELVFSWRSSRCSGWRCRPGPSGSAC